MSETKYILILGGGITALQTALSLLTSPHLTLKLKITLLASHFPGSLSPHYTSPWAGGHWRSHATSSPSDSHLRAWDGRTYRFWKNLLENAGEGSEEKIGLGFRPSRNFWGAESSETVRDGSGLWWRDIVDDFHVLDEKELPEGAVFGIGYRSICINVPRYLEFLMERLRELGAVFVVKELDVKGGLRGVVNEGRRALIEGGVKEEDILGVINCLGMGTRDVLVHSDGSDKEEVEKLYPIRGQTILVKGEAKAARTYTELGVSDELAYVIPRPGSGTTILGGCKQPGNYSSEVDLELSSRILERIKKYNLAPELLTAEGEFEIIGTQVGFRPGRKGGPRVEIEKEGGNFGSSLLIHAYGHAGAGYQNSVGSSEEVVRLVKQSPEIDSGIE